MKTMNLTNRKWLRRMFLSGVYMLGILGIVASGGGGGGGGGGDGVSFPTPTLPANAVVITAVNATDVATSALTFSQVVTGIAGKSEAPPSYWEIIKQATDPIIKRNRDSSVVATGVIEDLSFELCDNAPDGTAIADFNESGNSIAGVITFTNCEFFSGVFVSGNTSISASFNFDTGDYSQQLGGTLNITLAPDTVTIVFNTSESGNDFSGAFSGNVSFSLAGIADETYLVTTAQTLIGNCCIFPFPQLTDGELIVTGGVDLGPGNTQLSLRVVPGDMVDVFLDDGQGGGFVYHSSIDLTAI